MRCQAKIYYHQHKRLKTYKQCGREAVVDGYCNMHFTKFQEKELFREIKRQIKKMRVSYKDILIKIRGN